MKLSHTKYVRVLAKMSLKCRMSKSEPIRKRLLFFFCNFSHVTRTITQWRNANEMFDFCELNSEHFTWYNFLFLFHVYLEINSVNTDAVIGDM